MKVIIIVSVIAWCLLFVFLKLCHILLSEKKFEKLETIKK